MPSEGLVAQEHANWKPSAILAGIEDSEREGGGENPALLSSRTEALAEIRRKVDETFRRMDLAGDMKGHLIRIVGEFAKAVYSATSKAEIGSAKDRASARIQGIYDDRLRMLEDF